MTNIRDLTEATTISGGDLLPIAQGSSGRTRSVSYSVIKDDVTASVTDEVAIAVAAAEAAEAAAASADATILRNELADGETAGDGADLVEYASGVSVRDKLDSLDEFDSDLQNSADPAKGAAIPGWKRAPLADVVGKVAAGLGSNPVSVWEFANLVADKPTANDPDTWDWTPAFAGMVASGAKNMFVPPGTYRLRYFDLQPTGPEATISGYRFSGAGAATVLSIVGTDDDAITVTEGTSTISANIVFGGGGDSKPYVGNFIVRATPDVSYGIIFRRFFRGSVTENIFSRKFQKSGAVPFTYMNCVSTHAPNLTADECSRFIRLHGMADAVHFVKPTIYNCDADLFPPIFNEAGWLSASEPVRYTVGTIIDQPYCYREVADSTVVAGSKLIYLLNTSKCVVRDVWPEGIETSVELASSEKAEIYNSLSNVSGSGTSKVVLSGSSFNNFITTEGVVELSAGSIENTIITRRNIDAIVYGTGTASKNLIIAKDKFFVGKPMIANEITFRPSIPGSTGSGTVTQSSMTRFQAGTFTPSIVGGGTNPAVTYSSQVGEYQVVGEMVFFNIALRIATISGGSGEMRISGLPYLVGNSAWGALGETHQWAANQPTAWRATAANGYLVTLYGFNVNQISDLAANTTMRFTGFYFLP